ncbi:uncharacterized protein LOC114362418 [Ostrinia furnacalis]|uniref:uncharacterized protein LOC114362418 n=1 Tax=Ostrinia furnacalis TaxID=93504 RepID=UPI00103C47CA|nr:uncharacterized protein LOC114362418 [Ostrinia furnacalis]
MDEFQFDEMEVDTELAESYFEKNNYQFPMNQESGKKSNKDGYGNTIFYDVNCCFELAESPLSGRETNLYEYLDQLNEKFKRLATEVTKHAETFCQMEYLIRKIPVNEVRDYDIRLIVQNFTCNSSKQTNQFSDFFLNYDYLTMGENTPLAKLGSIMQLMGRGVRDIEIVCTKNTAAVCSLFKELCHSVGFDNISTVFVESVDELETKKIPMNILSVTTGCIGVVTEGCDIDSAIDTFLKTTTRYPWKLSRVLVQESVYAGFKKAFSWKASLKADGADQILAPIKHLCANAFQYDDKTFLVDYAGNPEAVGPMVPIEAYRTTKELISLVKKHRVKYLSLWASDIAQANEIAYNAPSSVVWINSYGTFDGPVQASQAIYANMIDDDYLDVLDDLPNCDEVMDRQEVWAKTPLEDRRRIVLDLTTGSDFQMLRDALQSYEGDNFVHVDKDRMCVGLTEPLEFVLVDASFKSVGVWNFARMLLCGSALILTRCLEAPFHDYLERLARDSQNIPIMYSECYFSTPEVRAILHNTKVISTNFGTIFAN